MAEKVYLFAKTYDDEASGRVFSAGPYPWRVVDTELQARIDALSADQVTELTALQGVPAQVASLSAQVSDLGALVAAADLAYATKSALDADTGQADDALALVFDDSTAANNGLYKSTSGAWSKTSLQLANPTELGQAVDFAGRNFFGVSTSAGTRDDLTTGSDLANNTFVFYTALPEGVLLEFRVFTLGTSTVKLKLFSKSGSTFTQQGADIELSAASGLKVFTPRETPAAVADLAFDDLAARATLFQEIQIGERAFTTATEKYYDEIDEGAFTHETLASDYLALIAGDSVSISDYALIDIILPCTYAGLDRVQAYLGATGISAWVLKVDTDSPGAGDPLCEPVSLTVDANGQINLAKSQLRGCVRGDRLSIIVYKSGGFEMAAPWVDWYGVAGKPDFPPALARATGSELLGQTLCGETAELADWTHSTGTVTAAAPLDSPPDGVTKVALVTDANTLGQGLTLGGLSSEADTEVEVTVTARNFPPLFDSTDTYPDDSQITATSHDFVNLVVSLRYGDSYSVPFTAPVGLWWTPVRFRTFIPAGSTDVRLFIASEGGALQIAEASVKVA